jgi:hypothetical protein
MNSNERSDSDITNLNIQIHENRVKIATLYLVELRKGIHQDSIRQWGYKKGIDLRKHLNIMKSLLGKLFLSEAEKNRWKSFERNNHAVSHRSSSSFSSSSSTASYSSSSYSYQIKRKRSDAEQIAEADEHQKAKSPRTDDIPKRSEAEKQKRVTDFLDFLKEKASKSTVRFVIDVDNLGNIEDLCSFFEGFDVYLSFYVKNQTNLKLPKDSSVPHRILYVSHEDDDDFAALTEALNEDCFILSNDNYKTYTESGLVTSSWLDQHKVSCFWKNSIVPAVPLHVLRRIHN